MRAGALWTDGRQSGFWEAWRRIEHVFLYTVHVATITELCFTIQKIYMLYTRTLGSVMYHYSHPTIVLVDRVY